ncbi:GntR family transcriptional regulator [Terrisporobacter petrolearius]|uniref:GntR family transcriptional regulator n=1 Tax=Terrisporobacter petrolearius TaxID=1460447 RepID=UPI0031CCC1C4
MSKLNRESAREQIRDSILNGIHNGTFPLGYKLREKELAQLYGTSQAPVREALRELEGLQYVETIPYKGTVVKEVTVEDLAIAYRLRGVFEQMAAEIICQHNESMDWSRLKEIANKIDEAAKAENKKEYAKYNVLFHQYFIEKSEVTMLKRMWRLVTFPTQVESALEHLAPPLVEFSKEHFAIIDALEKGDIDLVGILLNKHANKINDSLVKK